MKSKDVKVGAVLEHKNLGLVKYTEECRILEDKNPCPFSLFVEYEGDIREVSLPMIEGLNEG